jgi:hypothetical protein
MVITRLAQRVMQRHRRRDRAALKLRVYYDCNPPIKAHWTFRLFHQKVDPETASRWRAPTRYAVFRSTRATTSRTCRRTTWQPSPASRARMRRRFERGEFADANPNALFDEVDIDQVARDGRRAAGLRARRGRGRPVRIRGRGQRRQR